jgi:hypothetical protein
MPALYLNGRLCNGSGRSKEEYTLAELKTIAKDNGVFIFSGSNKEDICKELITYNKTKALPIVIAPKIAQTKAPIAVQPVMITRAKAAAIADLGALKVAEDKITADIMKAATAARALQDKAAANVARAHEAKAAANAAKELQAKAAANALRATQAKAAANALRATQAKAAANALRATQATAATVTTSRAAPKPKETTNNCVKQDDKKYVERPSPPYPANECRGKIMQGNNGEMYISKPISTGVYRWVKHK